MQYGNVNQHKFRAMTEMTLFLMRIKEVNPRTKILIHTIDLHRMNWNMFLYYIKLLKVDYIFFMYAPWFVRKIFFECQKIDYRHLVKQERMLTQFLSPESVKMFLSMLMRYHESIKTKKLEDTFCVISIQLL